jgi:hypothetical protein
MRVRIPPALKVRAKAAPGAYGEARWCTPARPGGLSSNRSRTPPSFVAAPRAGPHRDAVASRSGDDRPRFAGYPAFPPGCAARQWCPVITGHRTSGCGAAWLARYVRDVDG